MSYHLTNTRSEDITHHANLICWYKLLNLALDYGWKPLGTQPSKFFHLDKINGEFSPCSQGGCEKCTHREDGTEMNYWTNDFQAVSHEDAFNMALALERALEAIPKERIKIQMKFNFKNRHKLINMDPLAYFSGPLREYVEYSIMFCKCGEFLIG